MSLQIAIKDVLEGFKSHEFWMIFGANDIKKKYRRSRLGQFWITLSVAIFVLTIGTLYKSLFNVGGDFYMTYLAVGYIFWQFVSGVITKGGSIFTKNGNFFLQRNWPTTTFVLWLIYSEIIILAHNVVILIPIFLYWDTWPSLINFFITLGGIIITLLTAIAVGMIVAIMTLRYRDLQPITKSLIRISFFATPIIWIERDLGAVGNFIILFNPFGYFLHIIRDPILGFPINPNDWIVALCLFILSGFSALILLARAKPRLAFWL